MLRRSLVAARNPLTKHQHVNAQSFANDVKADGGARLRGATLPLNNAFTEKARPMPSALFTPPLVSTFFAEGTMIAARLKIPSRAQEIEISLSPLIIIRY
ncbi:MAG: hypothetical protein ACI9W2_003289 [Gammaproteobacteria bacterium]|jgi:hypothetical protein